MGAVPAAFGGAMKQEAMTADVRKTRSDFAECSNKIASTSRQQGVDLGKVSKRSVHKIHSNKNPLYSRYCIGDISLGDRFFQDCLLLFNTCFLSIA